MRLALVIFALAISSSHAGGSVKVLTDSSGYVIGVRCASVDVGDAAYTVIPHEDTCLRGDFGLFDAFGRSQWQIVDGSLVQLATARWAVGAEADAAKRKIEDAIENLLQKSNRVALWQARASLVAYRDRSSELAAIDAEIATLLQALEGN